MADIKVSEATRSGYLPKRPDDGMLNKIKESFAYDPESGQIRWASLKGKTTRSTGDVGWIHRGAYRMITVSHEKSSRNLAAHHIAWFLHYGRWPEQQIDHRDGDSLNNRIANLRQATMAENSQNQKLKSNNKIGVRGVYWDKREQKYVVRIQVRRKRTSFGYYDSLEEALAVRIAAEKKLFGEFAASERPMQETVSEAEIMPPAQGRIIHKQATLDL